MASSYPGSKDSFSTSHADAETMATNHASVHNDLADAINKIENELGILPKGNFTDVKTRMDRPEYLPFTRAGTLVVAAGAGRFYFPNAVTIIGVTAMVGTAPTGAAIIVDVNKNGTTIFTTQANRPQIAAGANLSSLATPAVTAFAAGDYISVDVDQIGSTIAGADLTVIVQFRR